MTASQRRVAAAGVVALALVAAYLQIWLRLDWVHQGRSDFGNAYVGAQIWRSGHGAEMYDTSLQGSYHDAAIAPDREPNLPFLDAPPAAALAAPFTLVDVRTGWRIWSALQLLMLAAACLLVARWARWPRDTPRGLRAVAVALGLAGAGTYILAVQGQWDGFFALGLALAYGAMRGGRPALAGALLIGPILAVKPNLALGLAVLLLGWGNRRALAGAAVSALAVGVACLAVAGPSGTLGFVHAAAASSHQWPWGSMNGITGVTGSLFGESPLVGAVGLAGSLAAAAAAFPLGRHLRRDGSLLDAAFAGTVALTLLASPHLYDHDLVLLAPALVAALAAAARRDAGSAATWPGRATAVVLAGWVTFIGVALQQLSAPVAGFPGRLVPWCLIGFAALAFAACRTARAAARIGTPAAA